MTRYFILIAYDGFNYFGWQSQKNNPSIQNTIENTISKALNAQIKLVGSGRTDAKAHALGQVAHFDTDKQINKNTFIQYINNFLPDDIRILYIKEISKEFHARFSVLKKVYHYYVCTSEIVMPHIRKTHLHVKEKCDLKLIQKACNKFIGENDFTSFANCGSNAKVMTKKIYDISCIETPIGFYLEFTGSGFLYKMVRNIVQTILSVNNGKLTLDQINLIMAAKDRRFAPASAPANALFLMRVEYPKQFDDLKLLDSIKPRLQVLELV
jgi:tRNA pseudouridine38-40 synthase